MKDKILLRIRALQDQINLLENLVQDLPEASKALTPTSPPPTEPPAQTQIPVSQPTYTPPLEPTATSPSINIQTSRWLGFIGVFCFIIGASFLIKLAINEGYLTPIRQVAMAAIFGGALVGIGMWRIRLDDESSYWSLLPGAGVAILYMSVFGGRALYQLYDILPMVLFNAMVTLLTLYLFKHLQQLFFAMAAVLGTYLCPLLFKIDHSLATETMVYFLFWDVTFVLLAIWLKNRLMLMVTAYAAVFVFAFPMIKAGNWTDRQYAQYALFEFVQFLIFFAGTIVFTVKKKLPLTKDEAWAYFPLLLFFYGIEYGLLHKVYPIQVDWMALAYAGLVLSGFFIGAKYIDNKKLYSRDLIYTYVAIVVSHSLYLNILNSFSQCVLVLAVVGCLIYLSTLSKHESKSVPRGIVFLLALMMIHNYFKTLFPFGNQMAPGNVIILNLMYAGLIFYAYFVYFCEEGTVRRRANGSLILWLANVQMLFGLYRLATEVSQGLGLETMSRFVLSLLWAIFAVGVLYVGNLRRDKMLARLGLITVFLSIAKVLMFDLSGAAPLVRVLCFFTLGAGVYAAGLIYRKIESWDQDKSPSAQT